MQCMPPCLSCFVNGCHNCTTVCLVVTPHDMWVPLLFAKQESVEQHPIPIYGFVPTVVSVCVCVCVCMCVCGVRACVCVCACVCVECVSDCVMSSKWRCWAMWSFDKDSVVYLKMAFRCQLRITIFPPHPLGALGWLFGREPPQQLRATVTQQPPSSGSSGVRLATSPIPDAIA